jgi:hypothetical protein
MTRAVTVGRVDPKAAIEVIDLEHHLDAIDREDGAVMLAIRIALSLVKTVSRECPSHFLGSFIEPPDWSTPTPNPCRNPFGMLSFPVDFHGHRRQCCIVSSSAGILIVAKLEKVSETA